jgi:hypothetical protein
MFQMMHEFLHTMGFVHPHTAENRDEFVEIKLDRIEKDKQKYFTINKGSIYVDKDFDYGSIMQLPQNVYGINESDTIVPIKPLVRLSDKL